MNKNTKIKFCVLAIIGIILFSFAFAPRTLQNDTYYTIAIGKHIVENGIDRQDPFSWHDLAYTYPHWLYDVCMYWVYSMRWNDWNIYIYNSIKLHARSAFICYKYKSK